MEVGVRVEAENAVTARGPPHQHRLPDHGRGRRARQADPGAPARGRRARIEERRQREAETRRRNRLTEREEILEARQAAARGTGLSPPTRRCRAPILRRAQWRSRPQSDPRATARRERRRRPHDRRAARVQRGRGAAACPRPSSASTSTTATRSWSSTTARPTTPPRSPSAYPGPADPAPLQPRQGGRDPHRDRRGARARTS